jgi:cytochrome P450
VLVDNAGNYVKSDQSQRLLRPALGQGLVTAEGAAWRRQRRIIAPMFQARRLPDFAGPMAQAVGDMLERWRALPDGSSVDAAREMTRLAYDVISRSVFSADVQMDFTAMSKALGRYLDTMGRLGLGDVLRLPEWVPTPDRLKARPALRYFRREIEAVIARRREALARAPQTAPQDLLTLLIAQHDVEGGLSAGEVFDNVITFIFAGHETTANALAWTLYLLSQAPAWDAALAGEAQTVLGGRLAPPSALDALAKTRMVLEESLRLYPPAPLIARDAVGADVVAGRTIRPGTLVLISPWILHRHKSLWDAPDEFRPERFAQGARETIGRFAYLPFGAGPRVCIGMGFAMQEALIALPAILQSFRLELEPGFPVEPLARITLRPRYGLKMRLFRRQTKSLP